MRELEKKVFSYIEEHKMLSPGERVVVGISGGADSVCLLFVLLAWKEKYGLSLTAVHVNHGIRKEAGEDALFVEELCRRNKVDFVERKCSIPELSGEWGVSEEEAGRIYRYRMFEEIAAEVGATKIAIAHNRDDLAETMLFHLFRGTGMKGLAGIRPVRDCIIRPILCAERSEIEAYLAELGQDYCTDATNLSDDYTRNRIRHHILGYAKELISGSVQHMGCTAEQLARDEDYLDRAAEESFRTAILEKEEAVLSLNALQLRHLHPAIGSRVVRKAIEYIAPGIRNITYTHVEDVCKLFGRLGNASLSLPEGIVVYKEYDRIVFDRRKGTMSEAPSDGGYSVDFQILSVDNLSRDDNNSLIFPKNPYTKWFDYDKMGRMPVVRTREPGDYLTIAGGDGQLCHKKLKDYMITEKIPNRERDTCPLLAVDSHILWVVGYRISEQYKVRENTKRILQVHLSL